MISKSTETNISLLSKNFRNIALLKLWVDPTIPGLHDIYQHHVEQHNAKILDTSHPDSGFDVFVPSNITLSPGMHPSQMINLAIKAEMFLLFSDNQEMYVEPTAFHLLPRSSLSKVPILQSNHVGLIDMGYRGDIMVPVRNLVNEIQSIESFTRLFQLEHPSACPILVECIDEVEDFTMTKRGAGGFGSTGVQGLEN